MNELDKSLQFQFSYTSDKPSVHALCIRLRTEIGELQFNKYKTVDPTIILEHLLVISSNLIRATTDITTQWIAYSRSSNSYKLNRYNKVLKYRYIRKLIDALIRLGFIEHRNGFRDKRSGISRQSRMKPTNKFYNLMTITNSMRTDVRLSNNMELIILKDKDKIMVDYTDNIKIKQMRKRLKLYNNFINKANIIHKTQPCTLRSLYRVFNDSSWDRGGRYYGSDFITMPKYLRRDIHINNSPIVEYDFSCLHATILYSLEGINKYNDDAYDIGEPDRKLVKTVFNCMLNCKSRLSASKWIKQNYNGRENHVREICERLFHKHNKINKYFYSSIGIKLQYLDSTIIDQILTYFTLKKIPVIPVHDSIIIEVSHGKELLDVMHTTFMKSFSAVPRIKEVTDIS